jgi:hypothetical protein
MRTDAMLSVTALVLSMGTGLLAAPAAHGDDVLTSGTSVSSGTPCPLRRVGDRLVRCDDLTGAGVPAPAWIPSLQEPPSRRGV